MPTLDIVVQENYGQFNFTNPILPPDRFLVADDVFIGKIDSQTVKLLLGFGDPKSHNVVIPARQWGYFYAFARTVPEPCSMYDWDTDQRLQTAIALSRLVRPTSISFRHAGRVRYEVGGSIKQAFPAWLRGVDPDSWLPPEPQYRDWLIEGEMAEIKTLFQRVGAMAMPLRVSRALWYHEYAARTYYGEVRWVVVCTALESLLNTYPYNSGAQFRTRLPAVASIVGVPMTEDDAKTAWIMRSHLSHGGATGRLNPDEEEIYRKLEASLREVLKRAILDGNFASIFADDDAIRRSWRVVVRGRSI